MANLLFKTYFRLNSINLSKNILRSLQAGSAEMPPLTAFPRAHQVTFKYYSGVIAFLDEDYATASENLTAAYNTCQARASKNKELILTYLIPTQMLTSHRLPTSTLLQQSPHLDRLFTPITRAIRSASLHAFSHAMEAGEEDFVKRRIYLTLERGRDIILRNLFRRVFIAGGYETPKEGEAPAGQPMRRTRVPVKEFAAALMVSGAEVGDGEGGVDGDEVECLIANCIYKVRFPLPLLPRWFSAVSLSPSLSLITWPPGQWRGTWRGKGFGFRTLSLVFSVQGEREREGGWIKRKERKLIITSPPQGFMKGYIARERGIVVLSKAGAFPGTGV